MNSSIPGWLPVALAIVLLFVVVAATFIAFLRVRNRLRGRREWIGAQTTRHVPVPKISLANGTTTTQVHLMYEVCYSIVDDRVRLHDARMSDGRDNGGNNAISFRGWGFKLPKGVVTTRRLMDLAKSELDDADGALKRRMFGRWYAPR